MAQAGGVLAIEQIATVRYADQKPGTSGLRKRVATFQQPHYLENFVQAVFDCLPAEQLAGSTILASGDGRYHNRVAIQTICAMAAANGVRRVWVGTGGLISTPAASCVIREREGGICFGGILLTASHNAGGPENDFGIKYNNSEGSPAPETLTTAIFERTKVMESYKRVSLPAVPIDGPVGATSRYAIATGAGASREFVVEVIDPVADWMNIVRNIFDLQSIRRLFKHPDFSMLYDGLHGVAGIYAERLFRDELECLPAASGKALPPCRLQNCLPREDFGGGHPDPNLTYAKDLVATMHPLDPHNATATDTPQLGAAGDGDNDRNMILGRGFFVTPSDSVAIIAAYARQCIPYFGGEGALRGVSRSMPTSCSLDNVARKLGINLYETPTGWKYFGNLMDAGLIQICGEESFGTGSNHIREKDGLWAVLCWLSILAHRNDCASAHATTARPFVTVEQIVKEFWHEFGRNYYQRYDYEEVDGTAAQDMMGELLELPWADYDALLKARPSLQPILGPTGGANSPFAIKSLDNFRYTDPVDGSVAENQGIRVILNSGSRIVWRLSGTGAVGATIRIYLERYEPHEVLLDTHEALGTVAALALELCQIIPRTGRLAPTVIT